MSKEIAEVENKGVPAVATLEEQGLGFLGMEDFDSGFESADADSFAIPFLQILQKMSPIVDEDDPRHVKGAKAGMLYNNVTGELFDGKTGVLIIPCYYKRSFIKWGGRKAENSGFLGEFTVEQFEDEFKNDPTKVVIDSGRFYEPDAEGKFDKEKSSYYADTRSHYVLVQSADGTWSPALMSLSSTQIKASKMLMTTLNQKKIKVKTPTGFALKTAPSFLNIVKMTTVGMSNDAGSWSGAKFELNGLADQEVFSLAKAFYQDVRAGSVNVDHNRAVDDGGKAEEEVETKPKDADNF